MKLEVATAIEELKRQFPSALVNAKEDGQGGAVVVIEPIDLGTKYQPQMTWMGFHLTAQYPYSDIYPVFIGAEVRRADGVPFQPPVTAGHSFDNRSAIQISRRNSAAQGASQRASSKVLKILSYLDKLAS